MKFFTPELYERLQDFSSDTAMDAAEAAWDRARVRYQRHLARIKSSLPKELRHLLEKFYLHDAEVLSIGGQSNAFFIVLRLDVPPHEMLVLTYQLLKEAVIDPQALRGREGSGRVLWMYDEVGLVRGKRGGFSHSILLSNGWEVRLRVSDLHLMRTRALYPVPGTSLAPVAAKVSRSA